MAGRKPTGSLQVKGQRGGLAYYALWYDGEGRHQKRLGPAHVRDSGKKTARGAVLWRAGHGPRPTDEHLTPADAEERLTSILAAAPKGAPSVRRAAKTFGDAVDDWLRYSEHDKQCAPSTLRGYEQIARGRLEPEFGRDTPLSRITQRRVEEYREKLVMGTAPTRHVGASRGRRKVLRKPAARTQQAAMIALGSILKRAKRRGWVPTNAAEDVERVRLHPSGDFNVLEPTQVEAVARACVDGEIAALVRFAAYTGLRMGELRAATWRDIDFAHATVHVRRNAPTSTPAGTSAPRAPKSSRVRSVPLSQPAAAAVDGLSRRDMFVESGELVFPSPTGGLFDGGQVRDAFYDALTAAGLGGMRAKSRPMTFHDLRHTFGTLAVRVAPLSEVQAWMGHQDIKTTMRYVHHIPQHDAAARLGSAFEVEATIPHQAPTAAGAG